MTASAPSPYQPYPYGPPPTQQQRPPAEPGALFRLLAGILGAVAAVLVLTGSFLPQTSFEQVVGGKTESKQTISAWSRSFDVEPGDEAKAFYDNTHVARYGIPLAAGSVVLLAGAGLAIAGARRSAGPRVRSGARTALLAGSAGVAGAVWMLGMDVSATLSYESDEGSIKSHYATGLGFWLLLGGGVLAVVALALAVLAGRRAPAPTPGHGPAFAGPPRGPYGRPAPYQQQSQPYPAPPYQGAPQQSQPFPGHGPASQPFPAQYPPSQPFLAQQPADAYGSAPAGDALGVTQAQPYPGQSGDLEGSTPSHPFPAQQPGDREPTEPNYQLPPLNPPKT
jgi:hypothetical protein